MGAIFWIIGIIYKFDLYKIDPSLQNLKAENFREREECE